VPRRLEKSRSDPSGIDIEDCKVISLCNLQGANA
jgi:hypothetical protein